MFEWKYREITGHNINKGQGKTSSVVGLVSGRTVGMGNTVVNCSSEVCELMRKT
jgi:hypothetical protein